MTEGKLFYLKVSELKIMTGASRIRQDMGEIKKLAESIKHYGQIQPVLITPDNEIVCGGRRVAACVLAGIEVLCAYSGEIDELTLRELELEENLARKDFSPAEEAEAIKEIHLLKQSTHGKASPGQTGGWTMTDTAKLLNVSEASVRRNINVASALEIFPELKKIKTAKGISMAAEKATQAVKTLEFLNKAKRDNKHKGNLALVESKLHHGDWKEHTGKEYDLIIADPPYGIDIGDLQNISARSSGQEPSAGNFDDSKEAAVNIYGKLAKETFRMLGDTGHCFVFFAPEYYSLVKSLFVGAGWLTNHRPIIWCKPGGGQTTQFTKWPAASYEMIFYFRKEESRLSNEGVPDHLLVNRVAPGKKVHPTEKPIELIHYLISLVRLEKGRVFDPCMGSGVVAEYCFREKLDFEGCEINKGFHSQAIARCVKLLKED